MKNIQGEMKRIERKDWYLWILISLVFLIFAAFILLLIFYSDLRDFYEKEFSSSTFNILFVGFTSMSLLFLAYILLKEQSIKKLRDELIKRKDFNSILRRTFSRTKSSV